MTFCILLKLCRFQVLNMPESIIDTELDEEVRKALILCLLCSKITIAPQSRVHPVSAVDL